MSIITTSISVLLSVLIPIAVISSAACTVGEDEFEPLTYDEFVEKHIKVGVTDDGRELLAFDDDQVIGSWDDIELLYQTYWQSQTSGEVSSNLLQNVLPNGKVAVWGPQTRGNMSYCIDTSFGEDYNRVSASMRVAARSWNTASAGHINFTHVSGEDSNCDEFNTNVVFSVRPAYDPTFAALAFNPRSSQPRYERTIYISTLVAFDIEQPLSGILRHELGHVLGLRHETAREVYGKFVGDHCVESRPYFARTKVDPRSVMITPACLGMDLVLELNPNLQISDLDKEGIQAIYK